MSRLVPASTSEDVWAEQVLLQIAKPHHFDLCLAQMWFEMSTDKESWQDVDDNEANDRRLTDMMKGHPLQRTLPEEVSAGPQSERT
jgi:hypothetical protein